MPFLAGDESAYMIFLAQYGDFLNQRVSAAGQFSDSETDAIAKEFLGKIYLDIFLRYKTDANGSEFTDSVFEQFLENEVKIPAFEAYCEQAGVSLSDLTSSLNPNALNHLINAVCLLELQLQQN